MQTVTLPKAELDNILNRLERLERLITPQPATPNDEYSIALATGGVEALKALAKAKMAAARGKKPDPSTTLRDHEYAQGLKGGNHAKQTSR